MSALSGLESAGEEVDEPERRAVTEAEVEDLVRIRVLGLAGQYAAAARLIVPLGTDRADFLATVTAQLDPAAYPFVHRVTAQLREHDDREQFLAGLDLILAGIGTVT